VWLQLPGWLALISGPVVCSLVWCKPSVLKWHVLPRLPGAWTGSVSMTGILFCSSLAADVLSIVCTHKLYKFLPWCLHLVCSCPVSIVKHIATKCTTETTLCCCPGTSVVLSSCATVSTMLAAVSATTATSSSSGHGEECACEEKRKSVCCWYYDWSSLDIYLPMILSVSCGKITLLILLHLYEPQNKTLWKYYHVMPTPSIN
jgi:hypothetical protein